MDIHVYDHDSVEPYRHKDDPTQHRVIFSDRGSELKIWLTEEQANALRRALDAIYPPAQPAIGLDPGTVAAIERAAIERYADAHAGDTATTEGAR